MQVCFVEKPTLFYFHHKTSALKAHETTLNTEFNASLLKFKVFKDWDI